MDVFQDFFNGLSKSNTPLDFIENTLKLLNISPKHSRTQYQDEEDPFTSQIKNQQRREEHSHPNKSNEKLNHLYPYQEGNLTSLDNTQEDRGNPTSLDNEKNLTSHNIQEDRGNLTSLGNEKNLTSRNIQKDRGNSTSLDNIQEDRGNSTSLDNEKNLTSHNTQKDRGNPSSLDNTQEDGWNSTFHLSDNSYFPSLINDIFDFFITKIDRDTQLPNQNSKDEKCIYEEDGNIFTKYSDDVDLISLSELVLTRLKEKLKKEEELIDVDLEKEKKKLGGSQNYLERNESINRCSRLCQEKKDIEENKEITNYLTEIRSSLIAYQQLPKKNNNQSIFVENNGNEGESQEDQKLRLLIIDNFFQITKKYLPLDIIENHGKKEYCKNCHYLLSYASQNVCPECGIEIEKSIDPKEDLGAIPSTGGNYNNRTNFIRIMKRKQGQVSDKLPNSWVNILDEYFAKNNKNYLSSIIINQPLNSDRTRGRSHRDIMYKALKECGLSDFYEDVDYICHIYWGWELMNFAHLETQLLEDYDLSQKVFENIKGNRVSSLNAQYRLYRHLEKLGYPCQVKDFKIVKTENILEYYEEIWAEICRKLSWPKPKKIIF